MLLKNHIKQLCFIFFLSGITNYCYADIKLRFGLYASEKPSDLIKKFQPIITLIEQQLTQQLKQTVSIKISIAATYVIGINQLTESKVDFMRMGPASYIIAYNKNPQIEILVAESKNGKKVFKGIISVKQNSAIHSIADLEGKSFAFGNEKSTIGRYLSQYYLAKRGIHAKDLATYKYWGRHDRVGAAIALGLSDAGALKSSTYEKLLQKGLPLRKLAEFDNVTKPWVASAELSTPIKAALKKILLRIKDTQVLKRLKKDGFLPATHRDYDSIRIAIEKNSEFFN